MVFILLEFITLSIWGSDGDIFTAKTADGVDMQFRIISEVEKPQGILAVIEKTNSYLSIKYDEDIIVVLDNIQDPGNMGTIIRTIDSARFESSNNIKGECGCI